MRSFIGYTKAAIELCSNPSYVQEFRKFTRIMQPNTAKVIHDRSSAHYGKVAIWYHGSGFDYATICERNSAEIIIEIAKSARKVDHLIEYCDADLGMFAVNWHGKVVKFSDNYNLAIYDDKFKVQLSPFTEFHRNRYENAHNFYSHYMQAYSILVHDKIRAELNKL